MKEIELKNLRGIREKHFLQKNGNIVAKMFDTDIHFKKGNTYEEIDNTLLKEENYFYNKNNSYKALFRETSKKDFFKIQIDNHFIYMDIENTNDVKVKIDNKLDSKLYKRLIYENIYDNIDFEYNVMPQKVKENIIIKNKSALINKITFYIKTDLELSLGKNNNVIAFSNDSSIFEFETPYIIDYNGKIVNDVYYELSKTNNQYKLDLVLNKENLINMNLKYPIIIDPTITNSGKDNNVYNTYIFPNDTDIIRYNKEELKAGVERINGKDVVNRTLLKFDLPKIGTGSQIIYAELNLVGYIIFQGSNESDIVNIHQITAPWTEESANWNNMNDKYNHKIEGAFHSRRSAVYGDARFEPVICGDEITNLVKKWYSSVPNYGIMLKENKEVYRNDVIPSFFSKNHNVSDGNPKPILSVTYRNQNGLENNFDCKMQEFNIGSTYVNTYTGNLTGVFEIGSTIGGQNSVDLKLVYNTNDVVLGYDYGLGVGYRFNLAQTIKEQLIGDTQYLEYIDGDSTIHYFRKVDNYYEDEDGLEMVIEAKENEFILKDKNSNQMIFTKNNNIGYLTKIISSTKKEVSISYNETNFITKIIDPNNQEISITYEPEKVIIQSPDEIVYLNYDNKKLSTIVENSGKTTFIYNQQDIIISIIDEDGQKYGYEYYEQIPFRIKKVVEYGIDDTVGNYFELQYNFNSTTLVDNKNRATTMTYNNDGNVKSISNLYSKENIKDAYAMCTTYGESIKNDTVEDNHLKNRLLKTENLYKYVKNYLKNTSFESEKIYFNSSENTNLSISSEESVTGFNSLKIVSSAPKQKITQTIEVPKNKYYTFSLNIKNNKNMKISLSYFNDDEIKESALQNIEPSVEFNKYDVTIFYPNDASSELSINIYIDEDTTSYIDDIQLEEGEVANNYNLIENSDFSEGINEWSLISRDTITGEDISTSGKFEVISLENGVNALKIKMNPAYSTQILKTFKICGKAGDSYNISFWYKNEGLMGANNVGAQRYNNVIMNFHYVDEDYGHCIFPSDTFNPNDNEWQYFSTNFYAEKDFDSIRLSFFQEFNANDLYITNICLFKDIRVINYDYDEMGNIKFVNYKNDETMNFNYNKDNQLTKLFSGNDESFEGNYEYDNDIPDRLISSINKNGISNEIEYDKFDNPILTRTIKRFSDNLEDGYFRIRLKGTKKYFSLNNNGIILQDSNGSNDKWCFVRSEKFYKVKHYILSEKYLTIHSNVLVLTDFENENSLFEFIKKDNGSYHIKFGDKYLMEHNGLIQTANLIDGDYHFEFYIESCKYTEFIENSTKYDDNGRFIEKTINTNFQKKEYERDLKDGLIKVMTDAGGNKTYYTYDEDDKLLSLDNEGKIIKYEYNSQDLIDRLIHGNKIYKFEYDKFLNLQKIYLNNKNIITHNYENNNGNLISSIYGNNQKILYVYDKFDRLDKEQRMNDIYQYKYNCSGDLAKVISNDNIVKYTYDMSKRLREYDNNEFKIKITYDANSKIVKKEYIINGIKHSVDYNYDGCFLNKITFDENEQKYSYDSLCRITNLNINDKFVTNFNYKKNGRRCSSLVDSIITSYYSYSYKYNKLENITHVYNNGILYNKYYYDKQNQLIREDNFNLKETIRYKYDDLGNILFKKIYDLNTYNLKCYHKYEYNNVNWQDQLTEYNNDNIIYDEIGNPLKIGSANLTWINGRELCSYVDSNNSITFKYNEKSIRTRKIVNNIETIYYLEGENVVLEKTGDNMIYYIRDGKGNLIGTEYNNNIYYYLKNNNGDIIGIIDKNNNLIVKYEYDSWGNILFVKDENNNDIINNFDHIGNINPFRYRGYYYDKETNLYYLNSRYYNPKWGRFISPDKIIGSNADMISYNLYSYCSNNPINFSDNTGCYISKHSHFAEYYLYDYDYTLKYEDGYCIVNIEIGDYYFTGKLESGVMRFDFRENPAYEAIFAYTIVSALNDAYIDYYGKAMPTKSLKSLTYELEMHNKFERIFRLFTYLETPIKGVTNKLRERAIQADMGPLRVSNPDSYIFEVLQPKFTKITKQPTPPKRNTSNKKPKKPKKKKKSLLESILDLFNIL